MNAEDKPHTESKLPMKSLIEFAVYEDPGISMISALAAAMDRYKHLTEAEKQAGIDYFIARYHRKL